MRTPDLITRRGFCDRSLKLCLGVAMSTLIDIPLVFKRAMADGVIGQRASRKKILFIFLRGANDALNSVIPVMDPAYAEVDPVTSRNKIRPDISIPLDAQTDYSATGSCDFPVSNNADADAYATFHYSKAIRLGNGFSALHPSLKFLAPVYNAGDLAFIHRVGYPRMSRSHFAAQAGWESGAPNDRTVRDGIFYRALMESGLATANPVAGVSIQSALPLLLHGTQTAMTNLIEPTRYDLLGVPYPSGTRKMLTDVEAVGRLPHPDKKCRSLLEQHYANLFQTRELFGSIDFTESANVFRDDVKTDNDSEFKPEDADGYYLFPTIPGKNGGYARGGNGQDSKKFVVDAGAYDFFNSLKAAALTLNKTEAVIVGTQLEGFDTHSGQGGVLGAHANLNRRVAWAIYALRKYFTRYADRCSWDNLVVVTMSEFGRTTVQNSNQGTDHGEAGLMLAAGGQVKGFNRGHASGLFGGSPADPIPWITGPAGQGGDVHGSMFAVMERYLSRCHDYRSVLGELIRDHLGVTQDQLKRIIPGYALAGECLQSGGVSAIDGTSIVGEPGIV